MPAPTDHLLHPHPSRPEPAVSALRVSVALMADGELRLDYRIAATPGGLRLPAAQAAGPADRLWQHTCCEAFIAPSGETAYREFNFSPSGQWAIYDFSAYRQPAASRPPIAPEIRTQRLADGFLLQARLPATLLPSGPTWQLGLSAVIEAADGGKSYWALAHTAEQPDFHCRPSFILNLSRPTP